MPDREIELLIRSLGINGTYRGYRYLCYGIKLCLEDEDYLLCISKLLYPEIARIFHTSGSSVERDIRTVRDVMMKNGGEQLLIQMTGSPGWADKIPYPRDLIAIFAQYLLRESGQNP